jgi:hypothetical protein
MLDFILYKTVKLKYTVPILFRFLDKELRFCDYGDTYNCVYIEYFSKGYPYVNFLDIDVDDSSDFSAYCAYLKTPKGYFTYPPFASLPRKFIRRKAICEVDNFVY